MIAHSWLYLIVAIVFGVSGTTSLKLSCGLTKRKPTLCLFVFYFFSFIALTFAVRGIDISIVYAIWSGLGVIAVAIIGVFLFDESLSLKKIISITMIILGVLGVHFIDAFN